MGLIFQTITVYSINELFLMYNKHARIRSNFRAWHIKRTICAISMQLTWVKAPVNTDLTNCSARITSHCRHCHLFGIRRSCFRIRSNILKTHIFDTGLLQAASEVIALNTNAKITECRRCMLLPIIIVIIGTMLMNPADLLCKNNSFCKPRYV